jgi:hypothetical protein
VFCGRLRVFPISGSSPGHPVKSFRRWASSGIKGLALRRRTGTCKVELRGHDRAPRRSAGGRRAPAAGASPSPSTPAASPPAAPARPPRAGRIPHEAVRTGRVAAFPSVAFPGAGLGGVAWTSPRFCSGESSAAATAEAPIRRPLEISVSNRRNTASATTPTRGRDATIRGTQASCSNIQAGTSRQRPASPLRLHRNAVAFALSVVPCTCTERPPQGCHGYRSVRPVVPWVFRRRGVQPGTVAPGPLVLRQDAPADLR